jgi:caa(3)-type oxidase subunit IV
MSDHAAAHAGEHHHPNYVKIWAILVGLLVVSVVGPMLGIRAVTLIAAFGIALVKAYMVAKNFMHVNVEKPIVHYALGLALVLMVLLYAGISPDAGRASGQNWVKTPGWHHLGGPVKEHSEKGKEAGEAGH